jgi:hypothetical protein
MRSDLRPRNSQRNSQRIFQRICQRKTISRKSIMYRNLAKRFVFAVALAAAAAGGAQAAMRDPYTDGARAVQDARDPYTDGARAVQDARDPYSEGARTADLHANGAGSAEPYHDDAHA